MTFHFTVEGTRLAQVRDGQPAFCLVPTSNNLIQARGATHSIRQCPSLFIPSRMLHGTSLLGGTSAGAQMKERGETQAQLFLVLWASWLELAQVEGSVTCQFSVTRDLFSVVMPMAGWCWVKGVHPGI